MLLRAQLIGGMPSGLVGALTDLVEGHFPVAAKARYADDSVLRMAHQRIKSGNAAEVVNSDPMASGTNIYAAQGAPAIAANVSVSPPRKITLPIVSSKASGVSAKLAIAVGTE